MPLSRTAGEGAERSEAGEGLTVTQRFENDIQNAFCIGENVVVPKPDHTPTLLLKPVSASQICRTLVVLTAIGLDDQVIPRAGEIDDIWTDRMLPAELVACQPPIAQHRPQPTLGVRRILSKLMGISRHAALTRLALLGTLSRDAGEGLYGAELYSPT